MDLLNRHQYRQHSNEWYLKRHEILTASNIASIFDANPYMSKLDLLIEKCKPYEDKEGSLAASWGIKYESVAKEIYSELVGQDVYDVGLFIHPRYKWLGASPDGLRDNGALLEIKCVWNRKLTFDIPKYYWIQTQIQMEVCDVGECDLFQCKFVEYADEREYEEDNFAIKKGKLGNSFWRLEKYSLNTISRDKLWFENNISVLSKFYNDILYYRRVGYDKLIDKIINYQEINHLKRSPSQNNLYLTDAGRSIKRHRTTSYIKEDWTQWINTSEMKNYILNDPLLDWLNMYEEHQSNKFQKNSTNDFNNYISEKEQEFTRAVIENLYRRFEKDVEIITIAHINEKFSVNKYQETINQMIQGRPIIVQGILHNKNNYTYGIPDLMVRTDYLEKICEGDFKDEVKRESNIKYNYCIVNIKYLCLTLKNGMIVNLGNVIATKSELIVCNEALQSILGYVPQFIYLIGYKYCGVVGAFKNIGKIDIQSYDYPIVNRTHQAIAWLKELSECEEFKIGGRKEMFPNMGNQFDYPWYEIKKNIAEEIGEITLLWNCGIKEREIAHQNDIFNWKNLENGEIFGFQGNKLEILNGILYVNRDDVKEVIYNPKMAKVARKSEEIMFFVDFETVSSLDLDFIDVINYVRDRRVMNRNDEAMIYMIGLGWCEGNVWKFETFIVNKLDRDEEKNMIKKWLNRMQSVMKEGGYKTSKLCHWSNAELAMIRKIYERHRISRVLKLEWFDLLKFFKDNRIAIKGALNYGLKTIGKMLYFHGLIETKWEDTTMDGMTAIIVAWEAEKNYREGKIKNILEYWKMKEIVKYNEIDCKVMMDIMKLFY